MGFSGFLRTLFQLPEKYSEKDFRARTKFREDYARLAQCLLRHLEFESAIDVGCANGFLIEEFLAARKTVRGLEVSEAVVAVLAPEVRSLIEIGDFSRVAGAWDLVCCVEMAEHVPRTRSEELVSSLCRVASRWIFFTAAPPGQGGHGHINCRPTSDWIEMFDARGFTEAPESAAVRLCLQDLKIAPWLRTNAVLLHRTLETSRR